jgi:predicted enzyme related to lactoylglutathione lyase
MPRVVHFEIMADDPDRAVKFFENIFGWKIEKWEGPMDYWLITTGKEGELGIDGAIARRPDPNSRITNTINVPDIDEYAKKVIDNGGTLITEKMSIPNIGYLYYFLDTEGNTHGIMQSDMSAK